VDKDSLDAGNLGNFRLYNLQTGKDDFMTPSGKSPRNRYAREKLREVLMHQLDIQVRMNHSRSTARVPKKGPRGRKDED
jgi:hypothetical protein